jgi:hypothetical protein
MRRRLTTLLVMVGMALMLVTVPTFAAAAEFSPDEHAFQASGPGREFATEAVADQTAGPGASESALISPLGLCTGP